jgi:hypothetical protein
MFSAFLEGGIPHCQPNIFIESFNQLGSHLGHFIVDEEVVQLADRLIAIPVQLVLIQ